MTTPLVDQFRLKVYGYGFFPTKTSTDAGGGDSLILDHLSRGAIGSAALRLGQQYPIDISAYVESVSIRRGRRRALDSFDASTCTIVLEDTAKRFDPNNTIAWDGVTFTTPKQLFRRGRPIQVFLEGVDDTGTAVKFSLWAGYIDSIDHDFADAPNTLATTTVACVDAFALAGAVDRNEADYSYGAGETMGPRILRWAEAAGLLMDGASALTSRAPYSHSGLRTTIDPPNSAMRWPVYGDDGTNTLQATTLSENALTAMRVAAASDDAWFYVDKQGAIYFRARASRTAEWKFSDTPEGSAPGPWLTEAGNTLTATGDANVTYEGVPKTTVDTQDVANYVAIARVGSTQRTFVDSSSIDDIGRISYSRTDLLCETDAMIDTIAASIISRFGGSTSLIVTNVRTRPFISDAALMCMATIDLLTGVQFVHAGRGIDRYMFVSGIDIEFPGRDLREASATYTFTED